MCVLCIYVCVVHLCVCCASMYTCLSVCVCAIHLCVCLSMSFCVCICMCVSMCVCVYIYIYVCVCVCVSRKEGNVLFNNALNTFLFLRLYGVGHMVKDHSDSEKGNPLPPHGLLFPISSL